MVRIGRRSLLRIEGVREVMLLLELIMAHCRLWPKAAVRLQLRCHHVPRNHRRGRREARPTAAASPTAASTGEAASSAIGEVCPGTRHRLL